VSRTTTTDDRSRVALRRLRPSSPYTGSDSASILKNRSFETHLKALGTPGYIGGLHHTSYVSAIRSLKSCARYQELEELLLKLLTATEAEAEHTGCAVMSSYYRELARVYRKTGNAEKEYATLARFTRQTQAPGRKSARLRARLAKVPIERTPAT
jgi:hypothetical protein